MGSVKGEPFKKLLSRTCKQENKTKIMTMTMTIVTITVNYVQNQDDDDGGGDSDLFKILVYSLAHPGRHDEGGW